MKELKGWILGEDGMHRVNPKWQNVEEPLLQTTLEENIKKEEMGSLVREEEGLGMAGTRKPALQKEGLVEVVRPAGKKKQLGPLGPRGLRKSGGYNYGGLPAPNYCGGDQQVEGWALTERNMKQEGYGFFPKSFKPPSFESKKTYQFVRKDEYSTVSLDCYKLADSCRKELKFCSFNPFSQELPLGKRLPRVFFLIVEFKKFSALLHLLNFLADKL